MKKIIIAFTAIITMIIFMSQPLFVNAESLGYGYYISDSYNSGNYKTKSEVDSNYTNFAHYVYICGYMDNKYYSYMVVFNSYNESQSIITDTSIKLKGVAIGARGGNSNWRYAPFNNLNDVSRGVAETNYFEFDVNSTNQMYSNNYYWSNFTLQYLESDLLPEPNPEINVHVSFSPNLSGNVDRSINNNGVVSMRSQLYMQVVNQSRFPIQYKMAIYKKHQQNTRNWDLTTSDNVFYDTDPIFVYYGDSWVYCTNCDDENTFLNADTVKENKSSPWHYVDTSSQDIVTFDFNQINMLEGEEYTVYVYAVRNDYGYASEQIVYIASSDPALSELKQIQGDDIETVYQSDFVMINYNDVKYDPNNSNNGVKPFNGRDGFAATQQYSYSRNARENQDGTIDYSSRNLYTNQNSWLSQQRSNALANHSTYSSGRVPASLSSHFNNFLSFITAVFGRMPTDIQSLYIYGFIALVVLGIVLKVVK